MSSGLGRLAGGSSRRSAVGSKKAVTADRTRVLEIVMYAHCTVLMLVWQLVEFWK